MGRVRVGLDEVKPETRMRKGEFRSTHEDEQLQRQIRRDEEACKDYEERPIHPIRLKTSVQLSQREIKRGHKNEYFASGSGSTSAPPIGVE
jgi:hypothetical protein